jgi:transcriptional regulator of heat shock response
VVNAEIGRRLAKMLASNSGQASFAIFPEDVSAVGMSNLLSQENIPAEDAREIAQFFDQLDEYADMLVDQYGDKEPEAFIGKELKLSKTSDYSMIVSGLKLPSGKKGVIGLIGPKSMEYPKNISLLEYISKLMGGGMAVIIMIHLIK